MPAKLEKNATGSGPLSGIKVLDMSRILAGPTCTQLLGDMGADVLKIEHPKHGDDTRKWGPPYVKDVKGNDTTASGYYLSANRSKRSVALDFTDDKDRQTLLALIGKADILVENFKVGNLKKYGLAYADIKAQFPNLIYCSITGFGQTGPFAHRPGYDFMIQAMGGIMSLTGAPEGDPHKAGVGIADVMCGMYASSAILAALHHQRNTGEGQYIDLALLDTQVSWLVNSGLHYLTSGEEPDRYGNGHPNIVPYDVFPTVDGYFALAVGNDSQYQRFCFCIDHPDLATDARFVSNDMRVRNREVLIPLIRQATVLNNTQYWLDLLEEQSVPCGPVNSLSEVFNHPQIKHRQMHLKMPYPDAQNGEVSLIANPIKFSSTQVRYTQAPPKLGEHTQTAIDDWLNKTK